MKKDTRDQDNFIFIQLLCGYQSSGLGGAGGAGFSSEAWNQLKHSARRKYVFIDETSSITMSTYTLNR